MKQIDLEEAGIVNQHKNWISVEKSVVDFFFFFLGAGGGGIHLEGKGGFTKHDLPFTHPQSPVQSTQNVRYVSQNNLVQLKPKICTPEICSEPSLQFRSNFCSIYDDVAICAAPLKQSSHFNRK